MNNSNHYDESELSEIAKELHVYMSKGDNKIEICKILDEYIRNLRYIDFDF